MLLSTVMLSAALLSALLLIAAALYALQRWRKRHVYALARQLRSKLTYVPFLGHSYIFFGSNEDRMKAFHSLGRDAIQRENGLCPLWVGTNFFTVIADPQAAEIVLKTSLEKDDLMKMATIFFGNGSIFAPVAIWKPRRKVLVSAFGTKDMKHFLSLFNKHSAALVARLAGAAGAGQVSAWRYFTAYTMDAVAEATLGYEMHAQRESAHPFLVAFDEGLKETAKRLLSPWLHSDLVYHNLPVYKKLIAWKNYLWTFTKELIDKKRKEMKESGYNEDETNKNVSHERRRTFLEMLVRSSGADAGYTDVEVLEELLVIMMAGNDTSAVGASFASLMLARHPRVQDAACDELRDVFGDSERPVTSEDLARLKYLDAVVRETLRLYAPVPVIARKIEKEIILPSGIKLVPGSGVIVHVWAINRHPRYWGADAEQFRPERFLDAPPRHPAAFMAFSHGPRNCVGYQFALTSMKTVLASVLRRYKLLPAGAARPLRLNFDIMMKDADGFQVQFEHRSKQ